MNFSTPSLTQIGFISGVALSLFHAIPWVAVFLLTKFAGIRLYILRDKEVCRRIQRRLAHASTITDGGHGTGICIGRWYYASVSVEPGFESPHYEIWMIATAASYERLTAEEVVSVRSADTKEAPPAPKSIVTVMDRTGAYNYAVWKRRRIAMDSVKPRAEQTAILTAITDHNQRNQHTVALIHGPPGTGKSMLGPLLAASCGGTFSSTLQPWRPGDSLAELYAEAEPTAEKPLIVMMDEIDCALIAIHGGIAPHLNVPIATPDKAGWNHFLDEIGRGMYPHLILLLTMNRSPEFIRSLDPSYIREGRVDLVFPLGA